MSEKTKHSAPLIYTVLTMLLAALFAILLKTPTAQHDPIPEIKDGCLDLSNWEYHGAFPLKGYWDFYWSRFLSADDFRSNPEPDLRVELPSSWNCYELSGKKLPGYGYATYRLHVIGAPSGKPLAVRVAPLSTAYTLSIDGEVMASNGAIGETKETSEPELELQTFQFTPNKDSFNIIIKVSNFEYARGGAWSSVYFGTPEKINSINQIVVGRDYFLLGSFFVISSLCLLIFVLRRREVLLLYAGMCFMLIIRTAINGSYPIRLLAPQFPFETIVRLNYITLYWLPGIYYWILHMLYPRESSKTIGTIYSIFASILSLITLVLPVGSFSKLILVAYTSALLIGIAGLILLIKAMKTRGPDTLYILIGIIVMLLCLIRDVLFLQNIIKVGFLEYYPGGFLVTSLLWCSVLFLRHLWLLNEKRFALQELMLSSEREKMTELKFLKSQIRPHFLNNALNTIISISRTDGDRSRALLVEFSKYLRGCYDFDSLDDTIPIENELSYVRSYLVLELARFGQRLHIEYDIDTISVSVPPLILQPLAENAVIHGVRSKPEGGNVIIYVKAEGAHARIGVRDDGVGIPPEKIDSLLSGNTGVRGVGLFNINQRLNRLYNTSLHIENLDKGVDIYMLIPYKEAD